MIGAARGVAGLLGQLPGGFSSCDGIRIVPSLFRSRSGIGETCELRPLTNDLLWREAANYGPVEDRLGNSAHAFRAFPVGFGYQCFDDVVCHGVSRFQSEQLRGVMAPPPTLG
jgi:hypothetical protein